MDFHISIYFERKDTTKNQKFTNFVNLFCLKLKY